jgi:hypothetical protein
MGSVPQQSRGVANVAPALSDHIKDALSDHIKDTEE